MKKMIACVPCSGMGYRRGEDCNLCNGRGYLVRTTWAGYQAPPRRDERPTVVSLAVERVLRLREMIPEDRQVPLSDLVRANLDLTPAMEETLKETGLER